jgi:S-adenosylmethionine:tRNA ribosyltransferase-isomerase
MKLSQFGLEIPQKLVALKPHYPPDEARMMVVHRDSGEIEHRQVKDILDIFDEHDLFVFNDTKVFPARLVGQKEKTGARIEVFLLRELSTRQKLWDVLVEPALFPRKCAGCRGCGQYYFARPYHSLLV